MRETKEECSDLSASGFTHTSEVSFNWCQIHITKARKLFDENKPIKAHLWSYRHADIEIISFDLYQNDKVYTMTLQATGKYGDEQLFEDWSVPDLVEALHIVGIFKSSLSLDIEIGRRGNEVNVQLLKTPLTGDQTNGCLKTI